MNVKLLNVVLIIVLFLSFANINSQPRPKPIFIETNIIPNGDDFNCYVSYRIPYKNLVFIKDNGHYTSGLTFTVEAFSDNKIAVRESSNETIESVEYEITESQNDYLEGIISFNLSGGKYTFNPIVDLENTESTIKLKAFDVNIDKDSLSILNPISFYNSRISDEGDEYLRIVNFGNVVPFSKKKISILIPMFDTSISKLSISIEQEDEEIISKEIESIGSGPLSLKKYGNSIGIDFKSEAPVFNLFILTDFSTKLKEGKAVLKLNGNEIEKEFEIIVEWVDKPFSLLMPELAINLLENLIDKSEVREMLKADEEDYYKELVEFWNPKDPNKETAFNEIMDEFYSRADIAINIYATLSFKNGAKTDRGKIYIKYGNPDDIVRTYSDNNEVIEIWKYHKSNKEFTFVDRTGLGNFNLY